MSVFMLASSDAVTLLLTTTYVCFLNYVYDQFLLYTMRIHL